MKLIIKEMDLGGKCRELLEGVGSLSNSYKDNEANETKRVIIKL